MKVEFHPQDVGITIKPPIAKEPFPTYDGEYQPTIASQTQTFLTKDKYMSDNLTINVPLANPPYGILVPKAEVGEVINHEVVITPKITISEAGWVTEGTGVGFSKTIRASDLVSGNKFITQNGTHDVSAFANAVVNVQPIGNINITENGTFDVASYANAIVNVAGSGGFEYETGIFTPTSNIAKPNIQFSQARSTEPFFVMMVDCSTSSSSTLPTSSSGIMWCIYRPVSFIGNAIINRKSSSSIGYTYAIVDYMYTGSSNTTTARIMIDDTPSSASLDVFLTPSQFTPSMQSTSRYWRKDRTYKWVAVWG